MDARFNRFADKDSSHRGDSYPGARLILAEEWPAIAHSLGLTTREWEVVVLCFRGLTREAIASELSISQGTVRKYLERIHDKLDVQDRAQLVLRVIECRDELRVLEGDGPRPHTPR